MSKKSRIKKRTISILSKFPNNRRASRLVKSKRKSRKNVENHVVVCPYCMKRAEFVNGSWIYINRPDLNYLKFWLCKPCDAYVGCHRDSDSNVPLGTLANSSLRFVRREAHEVFDVRWKSDRMTRSVAYKWLAKEMGINVQNCHIGMFDIKQCEKVIEICELVKRYVF